jgi:hypothetical protein
MLQDFFKRPGAGPDFGKLDQRGDDDMYEAPGACPVCGERLHVVRMECRECGTGVDGEFGMGRLYRLSQDQRRFVETFLKCRGKIKDVEEELGVSYPTVVARLNEVVAALGFEPLREMEERPSPATVETGDEVRTVLDQLSNGEISATEAATRLRQLG